MHQRLSQAKLQRFHRVLSPLLNTLYDAKSRDRSGLPLSLRGLPGLSRFVKDLLALPQDTDYRRFEVQLKRRLVRGQHRLFGRPGPLPDCFIAARVPAACQPDIERYDDAARDLLRALSDVDIRQHHEALKTVAELLS